MIFQRLTHRIFGAALAVCMLVFIPVAQTYVLQGPHILDLMLEEIGQANRLRISQKLIIYDPDSGERSAEFDETVLYLFPGGFRSEIDSPQIQRIHVVRGADALTVIDRAVSADRESSYDFYKDIFLYNSRPLLTERLFDLGVDVSVSSLGRYKGRVAYVIGAQYPDESVPQVWFDKKTFKPFRWILSSQIGQLTLDTVEVQYLGWRKFQEIWYPTRIEFFQNELLTRVILIERIEVDPDLSAQAFNINYLKSLYPQSGPILPDRNENEDSNEIRRTLENFNKITEP